MVSTVPALGVERVMAEFMVSTVPALEVERVMAEFRAGGRVHGQCVDR
jgi:hypothetical protein